jgi:STE24 endopeptidase
MDLKTFIADKIKGYLIAIIVGGLILGGLLLLINELGKDFWIWFWIAISLFLIFVNMFYTSLIVPLFNKLKPLEDGDLRMAIQEYSKNVGFPLDNIFVIDGSKRSTKANAYFSGLGSKKKIVLYDTLIQNHSKEELVAVLAHEVGHFKKKHIILGLILSVAQIGIMLFILSLLVFNTDLSKALGATTNTIHLNLIAFGILFSPISHLIGIFMNLISRKNEYEADRFAASTYNGNALQEALKKLSVNNLSNLTPHPAYAFFHYSHPPLLERLRALRKVS